MINNTHDLVLNFIEQFRNKGYPADSSYWFARILQIRFDFEQARDIVFDPINKKFACMIGDYVYDITGDASDNPNWKLWSIYDSPETWDIVRTQILKVPAGVEICALCRNYYDDDYGHSLCACDRTPHTPNSICDKGRYESR